MSARVDAGSSARLAGLTYAVSLALAVTFSSCASPPAPTGDDDQTSVGSPTPPATTQSPDPGDDDTTDPGDDDSSILPGDDDTGQSGDDDVTMSGDDDTTSPGDDDVSLPWDDDVSLPGDDDVSQSGDDDLTASGDDDASPGDDDDTSPPPPQPPPAWQTGVLLAADTPTGNIDLIRLSDSARLWSYSVDVALAPLCTPASPCFLYESRHVVHDDRDYVDFLASVGTRLRTVWERVAMDDTAIPKVSMEGFDFSSVNNPGCTASVQQTCNAPDTLPTQCSVWLGHGFQMLEDDPASRHITMILADHAGRILQSSLDYSNGNKCAHVDWILDSSNPDWDASCAPNDVQLITDHGTDYLAVTCRNMDGSSGKGQIQLFRRSGTGSATTWASVWKFPDPVTGTSLYLNTPHNGRLSALEDGGYSLHYAHSDGLGTDWSIGDAGTIGTASLTSIESPPDYLAEEFLGSGSPHPFGFLRALELAPDGERLVIDSGTQTGYNALHLPAVYAMSPQTLLDSSVDGGWTQTFGEQSLIASDAAVDRVYQCSWAELYSGYWLDPAGFGAYLRNTIHDPGTDCTLFIDWSSG